MNPKSRIKLFGQGHVSPGPGQTRGRIGAPSNRGMPIRRHGRTGPRGPCPSSKTPKSNFFSPNMSSLVNEILREKQEFASEFPSIPLVRSQWNSSQCKR